jgi:hypothetical protein
MAAFDNIAYSPGEPFVNVYDKINDTFAELKGGVIGAVLTSAGVGLPPVWIQSSVLDLSDANANIYITRSANMILVNIFGNLGYKTSGQLIYTIPVQLRTTTARFLGTTFSTYQAGGGPSQQGKTIPVTLNTNSGELTAASSMALGDDILVGSISYLLD